MHPSKAKCTALIPALSAPWHYETPQKATARGRVAFVASQTRALWSQTNAAPNFPHFDLSWQPSRMATKHFTRGRFFEDFEIGALYRHHWGRTITDGEAALFATWTMNTNPLYFNREHARALGHSSP